MLFRYLLGVTMYMCAARHNRNFVLHYGRMCDINYCVLLQTPDTQRHTYVLLFARETIIIIRNAEQFERASSPCCATTILCLARRSANGRETITLRNTRPLREYAILFIYVLFIYVLLQTPEHFVAHIYYIDIYARNNNNK